MASRDNEITDGQAIVGHFKVLPFEQQLEVLKDIQVIVAEAADKQRKTLLSRLAELDALAGRPAPAHPKEQAGEGRPRGKAPIKLYDPATQNFSTKKGSWQKTEWIQKFLKDGGDLATLEVGPNNPLPPHLANQ